MGGVGVGGEGISCNVAIALAIFMYFIGRCEICVCGGSMVLSAEEWSSLCNSL